ncbi:tripartite motif-containing protein 2-like [Magallana gigas]|uniref:tripartite motif-containing protein 2-like n=1 Tax=Magallana gigas TaxID=29159 RepID=UPI003341378E
MDRRWAQDVLRCHLCETPNPPMHCEVCKKYMCKVCVKQHLFDESKEHIVVPLENRGIVTKCSNHSTDLCDIYCEQCDIPFCVECVSSGKHLGHKQVGILKILETKRKAMQRDLQELEKNILPKYHEIASNITVQKAELKENSQKQTTAIIKHGEDLHQEIDTAIQRMKADLNEMDSNNLVFLNKQEDYLKATISVIMQSIEKLNKLLNSNDVSIVSAYKCRNAEFRRLPPKHSVPLPSFTHPEINKKQIYQQFGSLSAFLTKTEERGYTTDSPDTESSPPDRPLDEPRITVDIKTAYAALKRVSCLSDEQIWTCGNTNIMTLYNLRGNLVNTIQTKSGKRPSDIAVTMSGDLVYADALNRTVNIVTNTQIQEQVRLRGWRPSSICRSFSISGDLLGFFISDDGEQAKVVRYSGSTEKQVIQYDDKGQCLYLSCYHNKICENRNLDICVSTTSAVVVVNLAGKHRFTYTGPPSTTKGSFVPRGITTDSKGQILIADLSNCHIHIIDMDGQFLRYIDNCVLLDPSGLCVDTRDNLFVAEFRTTHVKKIKY